jgi:hypothetical protein
VSWTGGAPGAGDWERGELVLWGGPFDQADFEGSWEEGNFDAVAVDDLLILSTKVFSKIPAQNQSCTDEC